MTQAARFPEGPAPRCWTTRSVHRNVSSDDPALETSPIDNLPVRLHRVDIVAISNNCHSHVTSICTKCATSRRNPYSSTNQAFSIPRCRLCYAQKPCAMRARKVHCATQYHRCTGSGRSIGIRRTRTVATISRSDLDVTMQSAETPDSVSSQCAICCPRRSPMMENAAGSCELPLLRHRSDSRVSCCVRQHATRVK